MTPTEEAILRGIAAKLDSSAGRANALSSACEPEGCCRGEQEKSQEAQATGSFMLAELPGAAAWDMLIYLFVVHANGKTASMASCCRASGVPSGTGSRFVESLAREGLIVVEGNQTNDGTRPVSLSDHGRKLVEKGMHNFIKSRSKDGLDSAFRSIGDAFANNRIAQEMGISLRSIESHRANMLGKRR